MAQKETENNAFAKFLGDKQRALWYVMVFSGVVNSNKLRLGLGRCHLEQRAYCLNVNWQIQVGTMGHF